MMKNEAQINEVRTILLSLLVANQHNLPLVALDREYFQVEKERIPWRKFGYESLQVFLESMPQHFSLYNINGITYVKGIASEKSMHVKSLVNRQKSNTKPRYSTHTRNQNVYLPPLLRTPMRISASMLSTLLQYISKFPSGISIQNAMQFIQTQCPNIKLSAYDLKAQLREVSHQVYLDNNMIYFRFNTSQRNGQCSKSNSQGNSYASSNETLYVAAGVSDEEDCVDNIDVAPGNYVNDNQPRRSSEEFAADLLQNTNQMQNGITNNYDDVNVNELATARHNAKTNEIPYSSRVCALISDKIKSRLRELVQKYPDGITCAELPDKYLKEFKIHLNYVELGFSSVREFVLYLPQIFYLEQLDRDGDYLLLSADKRPTVPDQESPKENIENKRNSRKRNEEEYKKAEDPPVPTDIPPNIANRAFVPENAINYYESVKLIPVTELRKEKFLEVYISEVFNPSFFWVHLRRYKNQLINLMEDINEFYNRNFTKNYLVPKVGLMKGLHCACIYDDKWHRGVIKSVKPDFQVTILFIDYGTVKTYPPDNICYLDKRFIHLPVQAIPCGLINIKPHIGDRWNSTTNRYFCDKVSGPLLAATIHSIDIAHNSMMIVLTDTSEEEEVHINDWLVNEKLARRAKTDTVDMANLVKYALNVQNRLPIYCFAEDNLIPERHNQATSTEDIDETVPSEQIPRDSSKQQVIKPPPGFKPLEEIKPDLSTEENPHNCAFENVSDSVNSHTSPIIISADSKSDLGAIEHLIMALWSDNVALYNKIFDALPDIILKETGNEAVLKNHITIQKELNMILRSFVKALKLDDDKPIVELASDPLNGAMPNGVGSAPKNPLSSNNDALNQKTFEVTVSPNPFIPNNGSICNSNLLNTSEPSPPVQRSLSPLSSMFKNYIPDNFYFSPANQKAENVPLTISGNSKSSTSYCNANKSVLKETNPFRMLMTDGARETQNEPTNTYANSRLSSDSVGVQTMSYYTAENSQNYSPITENTNARATNNNFSTFAEHFYANNCEKYSPKIVYESGPVMYNTQTKQNKSGAQSNNTRNITFDRNQCDKNLPFGNSSTAVTTLNSNECYVNRPPINYVMQPSSVINNKPKYHSHNANESQTASARARTHMENPEQLINWSVFSQNHNGNFTHNMRQERQTVNVPQYQTDLICNVKEFVPRDVYQTPVYQTPDQNFLNQINYLRKQLSDICTNSYDKPLQKLGEKQNMTCNAWLNKYFFFIQTDPMKGASVIFHLDGNGWILVYEFIQTFTDLKSYSALATIVETMKLKEACQFREVQRSEYPLEFSHLDSYPLNLLRDSKKRIISISLISLHTALLLLYKLKKILPEDIDNIYKRLTCLENDSVLNKMLTLMIEYMNFKQQIEKYYTT